MSDKAFQRLFWLLILYIAGLNTLMMALNQHPAALLSAVAAGIAQTQLYQLHKRKP